MNESIQKSQELMDKIVHLTEKARKEALAILMGEARMREREKEWEKIRRVA